MSVKMVTLDDLPRVDSLLGIDLKTGSVMIATIGLVHPMIFGCSYFIPMSYLLVSMWILVAIFFAASAILLCGILKEDAFLCGIWVIYAVIFVSLMLLMMLLQTIVYTGKRQRSRVFVVLFGFLWYLLTAYFVLVVNSYRMELNAKHK